MSWASCAGCRRSRSGLPMTMALDRYTLQPPAPAAPVVVEVPYSTY
jgi:hypothetical protein